MTEPKSGSELYDIIMKEDPTIRRDHRNEYLWIDQVTEQYVIGGRINGWSALQKKVGVYEKNYHQNFYSRRID